MSNEVYILDTNIWISYIITRRLQTLVALICDHLTVLTSQHLVKEVQEVLARPKFTKYIRHADIKEATAIHLKICRFVATDGSTNQLSDAKDDFLLSLFNTGKATILVSGDKDLLREANEMDYRV